MHPRWNSRRNPPRVRQEFDRIWRCRSSVQQIRANEPRCRASVVERRSPRSCPELRFLAENHVDFGARSRPFSMPRIFSRNSSGRSFESNQAEKRAFRIGVRKQHARFDFRAVIEKHSLGASVSNVDARDACGCANFHAMFFCGTCEKRWR